MTTISSTPTSTPEQTSGPKGKETDSVFKKWADRIIGYGIPFAISVTLIVWLFKKVNFHEVMHVVNTECDFFWIGLMMAITTLSHTLRGIRWGIQLRGAGLPRVPTIVESISIYGAYALNLVFPRLGEAWRCVYMARREKAPLSTVIGTDVGDRSSDAVVVVLLTVLALITAHPYMEKFLDHYSLGEHIEHYTEDPWLWGGIIVGLGAFWAVCHYLSRYKIVKKIDESLENIWTGFADLFRMKRGKWHYVWLTLGIWTCYFMETYVCFYAFPFTRELITDPGSAWGLVPGLVVFVFGSFSMAIPSNGGLGPWNLAVMFALSLFGISDTQGTAFSLVMWSWQAIMLVGLGLFSAGYILAERRKREKH